MDCRLDDLIGDLVPAVLEFCISLYRKIHYNIYHDNDYRDGLLAPGVQILEYEGDQLIQNIMILSNYYEFNKKVRAIICEKCKYEPTKNDKFNLYSDDPINRKRLAELKKNGLDVVKSDTIKNLKRLFDQITDEQIETLYINKNI